MMATKIDKMKWKLHLYKRKQLLLFGLMNGLIAPYDEELIERLRTIHNGSIPASIILLSNAMSNGKCYDRAELMSRVFLEDEGDVQLVYASIDSIRLNPKYIGRSTLYDDHCIVERTTKDGRHLIYDTSEGLIYDKSIYWLIERPRVRKINSKESIKEFLESDEDYRPRTIEEDRYAATLLLPFIESTYGRPSEMYSMSGVELLQKEVEHYKSVIDYESLIREREYYMKRKENK